MRKSSLPPPNFPTWSRANRSSSSTPATRRPTPPATCPTPSTSTTSSPISPPRRPKASRPCARSSPASSAPPGCPATETAVVYEQSMNTGFGQSCRGYVLLRYLGYPEDQDPARRLRRLDRRRPADLDGGADARAQELPARSERRGHPGRSAEHEGGGRRPQHRQARHPRRRRVDRRFVLALRQGFLPAQGTHPGRASGSNGTA